MQLQLQHLHSLTVQELWAWLHVGAGSPLITEHASTFTGGRTNESLESIKSSQRAEVEEKRKRDKRKLSLINCSCNTMQIPCRCAWGTYTEGIRLVSAGRLCLSIYPFMSGNQALSRKRFQAKQTQQNTNKWSRTSRGGAALTRGTLRCKAGQRGRAEGEGVSTTLMMTHRITSQDAKVTTESLCE